jgi:hypothetical protein
VKAGGEPIRTVGKGRAEEKKKRGGRNLSCCNFKQRYMERNQEYQKTMDHFQR